MRPSELESPTPTMSRWCSNQLSYGRTSKCNFTFQNHDCDSQASGDLVRPSELESPTPTMSRWCSNQLSYGRIVISVYHRWQRGRILTTYRITGKGKNAF